MNENEVKKGIGQEILNISKNYYPTKKLSVEEEMDFKSKNLSVNFNIYKGGYQVQLNSGYESGYKVFGLQKDSFVVDYELNETDITDVIAILCNKLRMVRYTIDELGMITVSYIANEEDEKELPFYCVELNFSYMPRYFSIDLSWINRLFKTKYSEDIMHVEEYCDNSINSINTMNREELLNVISTLDDDVLKKLLTSVSLNSRINPPARVRTFRK